MKLKHVRDLIDAGPFTTTRAWQRIERELRQGIEAVVWPPGSQHFTINPERRGNGVKPIKDGFVTVLRELGWKLEQKFPPAEDDEVATRFPGKLDALLDLTEYGLAPFAVEWETGNIASSHRAMNKMALALKQGRIAGGALVLPSRALYRYLTDRIGNYEELEPYIWKTFLWPHRPSSLVPTPLFHPLADE